MLKTGSRVRGGLRIETTPARTEKTRIFLLNNTIKSIKIVQIIQSFSKNEVGTIKKIIFYKTFVMNLLKYIYNLNQVLKYLVY